MWSVDVEERKMLLFSVISVKSKIRRKTYRQTRITEKASATNCLYCKGGRRDTQANGTQEILPPKIN